MEWLLGHPCVKESRVALQKMVFIKHLVLKSTACGVVIGTSLCLRAQHVKWLLNILCLRAQHVKWLLGHPCVKEHGTWSGYWDILVFKSTACGVAYFKSREWLQT